MNLHKKKYNSKFILTILIFLFIMIGSWSYYFYNITKDEIEDSFRIYSETVAMSLSNTIEESSEAYKELLETHNTDSDFYRKTYNAFVDIAADTEIAYVYTVQWYSEDEIMFIIDCVPLTDPNSTPIGTVYEMGQFAKEAFEKNDIVSSGFVFYESWEDNYLSAFSPIIDPTTNETLGLVGVDIIIDELQAKLNYLLVSLIIILLVVLIITYILLTVFSDLLVKPYVTDGLTKIYNRKFFDTYIIDICNKAKKRNTPISLLTLDIDHFKRINDTYGHSFGDKVLQETCSTITKNLSKTHCFARYGGEEFVILVENAKENDALQLGSIINTAISNLSIHNKEKNEDIKFTISIGIACLDFEKISTIEELKEKSDKALYNAKINRNSVKVYSEI
ncbi:MAG: GGDEF domain-containing protein [Lachnospirales bacterium]